MDLNFDFTLLNPNSHCHSHSKHKGSIVTWKSSTDGKQIHYHLWSKICRPHLERSVWLTVQHSWLGSSAMSRVGNAFHVAMDYVFYVVQHIYNRLECFQLEGEECSPGNWQIWYSIASTAAISLTRLSSSSLVRDDSDAAGTILFIARSFGFWKCRRNTMIIHQIEP